jgi:hypothetical protein
MRRVALSLAAGSCLLFTLGGNAFGQTMSPRQCPVNVNAQSFTFTYHSRIPNVPPYTGNFTTSTGGSWHDLYGNGTQEIGQYTFGTAYTGDGQAEFDNPARGAACWYNVLTPTDSTDDGAAWGDWSGSFAWIYYVNVDCNGRAYDDDAGSASTHRPFDPNPTEITDDCADDGSGDTGGGSGGGSGSGGEQWCAYYVWYDTNGNIIEEDLITCWQE